jgi:hypothetical protein
MDAGRVGAGHCLARIIYYLPPLNAEKLFVFSNSEGLSEGELETFRVF